MIDFNPREMNFGNVDRFYIKKSIFQFLITNAVYLKGNLLDIGCGEMPYKQEIINNSEITEYTGLDIFDSLEYNKEVKPDFFWDGIKMPFDDQTFDSGFATEVLEHCPDPLLTLKETIRVLKPDSPLILTVPFLWPTHESPNDFYRYTPFALEKLLDQAGFENIEMKCLGGWDASLAQMIGLWIKRKGFSIKLQRVLFFVFRPFILKLFKMDSPNSTENDQNMYTNLGIVAWKK